MYDFRTNKTITDFIDIEREGRRYPRVELAWPEQTTARYPLLQPTVAGAVGRSVY